MEVYALESLCSGQAAILLEAQASVESIHQSTKAQRKKRLQGLKGPCSGHTLYWEACWDFPVIVLLLLLPVILMLEKVVKMCWKSFINAA